MPRAAAKPSVAKPITLQAALAAGAADAQTPLRTKEVAELGLEIIREEVLAPKTRDLLVGLFEPAGILGTLTRGKFDLTTNAGPISMYIAHKEEDGTTSVELGLCPLHDQKAATAFTVDFEKFRVAIRDLESRLLSMNDSPAVRFALFSTLVFTRSRPEVANYRTALNALIAKDKDLTALGCQGIGRTEYDNGMRLKFAVPDLNSALAGQPCNAKHPWTQAVAQGAAAAQAVAHALGQDIGAMLNEPTMQAALRAAVRRLASDTVKSDWSNRTVEASSPNGAVTLSYTTVDRKEHVEIAFAALTRGATTTPAALLNARKLEGKATAANRAQKRFQAIAGLAGGWKPTIVDAVNAGLARTAAAELIPGVKFAPTGLTFPASPV